MYTVVTAMGVSKEPQARWGDLNLTALAVFEIFNSYREVYLTLSANYTPDPIYVNLEVFRVKYSSFEGSLEEMLEDNANATFETLTTIPIKETKFAIYQDMFRAGYKVNITGRNSTPDSGIPREDKIDLRIFRDQPATSMQDVRDYCLINVNGYYHMTDTDGEYLYVLDGARSAHKSRHNSIGMLSFRNIGKLAIIPITASMIYKQSSGSQFYDKTYIKVPTPTEGKVALMVIGGYLVFPDKDTLHPVGNDTFGLNLSNIPLIERYYESRDYIDYTALGLDGSDNNESTINLAQFYSDSVMLKYLTMSQSFVVLVDTAELFTNKLYIGSSRLPGMFTSSFEPMYPLITGRGKVSTYWKILEDGVWSINVTDSYLNRRVFGDLDITKRVNVTNSAHPLDPYYDSSGYLLEIGSDFVPV